LIFVDSNIPMYLVGGQHPHKAGAARLLDRAISRSERLVTNAEVLQEICQRYGGIGRRDAIQPAFDVVLGVVDEVLAVTLATVEGAKQLMLGRRDLSARDAVHLSSMAEAGVRRIMSFDRGFDGHPGIERLS
jgi:predicted nucleic acid-binding protein